MRRRFPLDPPKGKGGRLADGSGILASANMPVLLLVEDARERYIRLHGSDATTPRMSGESGARGTPNRQHSGNNALGYALTARDQQITVHESPKRSQSSLGKAQLALGRLIPIKEVKEAPHDGFQTL